VSHGVVNLNNYYAARPTIGAILRKTEISQRNEKWE